MKDITFGFVLSMLLTTLMFGMSLSLFAQGEEPPTVIKKEIKIKKIIDEDGNETTETIETEVEVDASEWENIEGEFDIDIDETIENGVKKRIVRVQAGGENGELPQEIQDELESLGIDINIIEESEKRTIIIDSDEEGEGKQDHDIRIFKMNADEEMPEDIRKILEEQGIDLDEIKEGEQKIRMYKTDSDFGGNNQMNRFFRKENRNVIDRQTKMFRITNIDVLDSKIINEIAKMGISETELRERFDAAEKSVRISKEGLENTKVELDILGLQEQMFMRGMIAETIPNPDADFEWTEKKKNKVRIPRIATKRGYLGVNLDHDATILKVESESPAANAGLEAGDRLLKIGKIKVETADEVIKAMEKALPGTNTNVAFQRANTEQTVTVVPEMPPHRKQRHRHKNTCSPDDKAHWMKRMEADCERRCSTPFLGIYMEEKDRDFDNYEVKITGIVQHTGAEDAGILEGDILLKVNRASVSNVEDVVDEISKYEPGDKVKVQVLRDGKKKRIKATLSNQTQADIFSPCDCSTGEVNAEAMTMREIILIKENAADIQIDIDTDNTLNLDEIDLFPNPNNGTFTVRFTTESKAPTTIWVIDVSGKEVYREVIQDFNGRYDNRIDISNQAKGTYFLNINQGDKIYTEQFILTTK